MNAFMRAEINRKNAQNSTGPTSASGKQTSALNGIKHGLTGQRLLLLPHELEPYQRMSAAFRSDYSPQTELESQLIQHIVDCNMRLHRIAAIEGNMFAVGTVDNIREDVEHDNATEAVIAQTRAWIKQADSFEKLGRHEGRISRQLLKYTQEIDRVQTNRKNNPVQLEETKPDNAELALLCNNGQALSPQASGQSSHVLVRASSCKAAESPATMAAAVAETPGAEAPAGPFLVQPSVVRTSEQAQPSNPARTFGTIPDAMII